MTIPKLDECLAEGFRLTVDPLNAAIIIFGFAGLAVEWRVSGRSTAGPRAGPVPGPYPHAVAPRFARTAIVLILLDVIVAGIADCLTAQRDSGQPALARRSVRPAISGWWGTKAVETSSMIMSQARTRSGRSGCSPFRVACMVMRQHRVTRTMEP